MLTYRQELELKNPELARKLKPYKTLLDAKNDVFSGVTDEEIEEASVLFEGVRLKWAVMRANQA